MLHVEKPEMASLQAPLSILLKPGAIKSLSWNVECHINKSFKSYFTKQNGRWLHQGDSGYKHLGGKEKIKCLDALQMKFPSSDQVVIHRFKTAGSQTNISPGKVLPQPASPAADFMQAAWA